MVATKMIIRMDVKLQCEVGNWFDCGNYYGSDGNQQWCHSQVFPEMRNSSNYCRNGGGIEHTPWCYTMDPLVRWQHCHIEKCGEFSSIGWPMETWRANQLMHCSAQRTWRRSTTRWSWTLWRRERRSSTRSSPPPSSPWPPPLPPPLSSSSSSSPSYVTGGCNDNYDDARLLCFLCRRQQNLFFRLCRPRPGYTIAKVQVFLTCTSCTSCTYLLIITMKKIAMTMNNHHELQDGDIDLGKLAENSNYHTTGATLHPRYKIFCNNFIARNSLINNCPNL